MPTVNQMTAWEDERTEEDLVEACSEVEAREESNEDQREAEDDDDDAEDQDDEPACTIALEVPTAELSDAEAETVIYIVGSVVRQLLSAKNKCEEYLGLCMDDSAPVAVFSKYKDFNEDSLINTSLPLRDLARTFENVFKFKINDGLYMQNPRQFILNAFFSSCVYDFSPFHCSILDNKIVLQILTLYCNIRLFHTIKLCNEQIKSGKKGTEWDKNKKLNVWLWNKINDELYTFIYFFIHLFIHL